MLDGKTRSQLWFARMMLRGGIILESRTVWIQRCAERVRWNDGLGCALCYKRSRNCSTVSPASRTIPP